MVHPTGGTNQSHQSGTSTPMTIKAEPTTMANHPTIIHDIKATRASAISI